MVILTHQSSYPPIQNTQMYCFKTYIEGRTNAMQCRHSYVCLFWGYIRTDGWTDKLIWGEETEWYIWVQLGCGEISAKIVDFWIHISGQSQYNGREANYLRISLSEIFVSQFVSPFASVFVTALVSEFNLYLYLRRSWGSPYLRHLRLLC